MIVQQSKNMKNENFPVEALVNKNLRPIVSAYYKAARLADDIADSPILSPKQKLLHLTNIEQDFQNGFGKKKLKHNLAEPFELGWIFADEGLAPSLYTDLLRAFEKDASNQKIAVWEQLIDYCSFSAAPVGRFILALYNESPSCYLQAEILCAVLQITNHLQDLRKDAETLKRCYLPQDMMDKYDVRLSDIYLNKSSPQLCLLLTEMTDKLSKMLKDASVLPALVRSIRLKIQIGIILSLTNSMIKKIKKYDVLTTHIKLDIIDWVKAFSFGALRGLTRRTGKSRNIV